MDFDWKNPDYLPIYIQRKRLIKKLRDKEVHRGNLKEFYKTHPVEFISTFGMTFDPRNVEVGLPATMPFIMFPKQDEFILWLYERWQSRGDGLAEKSRDMGISWLCVAFAVWMWVFYPGSVIGFGSRKESYVDDSSDPKSLFWKIRFFIAKLPREFRPDGYSEKTHAPFMKISNPENGAMIVGEAGDNIGRGNRTSIYFKDESAFYERPDKIDAALSQTSNCKIDVSTPNGIGNPFYRKRHGGKIPIFTFNWRDDPRKGDDWYAKQVNDMDAVHVAQEIDINYSASVEGVLIPNIWVMAAVDAHKKLNIEPSGIHSGSLDVADEGRDANAFCGAHGILIEFLEEWSGTGGDIFGTVSKAFHICDLKEYKTFKYDADGLGAGVRGDARIINGNRSTDAQIEVIAYRGSEGVLHPDRDDVKGRKNIDFFANRKSQSWWALRTRFQNTYRAVIEGKPYSPDSIISISGNLPCRMKLMAELSQPTYAINQVGKILIEKTPEGTKSPNLADAVCIQFSQCVTPITFTNDFMTQFAQMGKTR